MRMSFAHFILCTAHTDAMHILYAMHATMIFMLRTPVSLKSFILDAVFVVAPLPPLAHYYFSIRPNGSRFDSVNESSIHIGVLKTLNRWNSNGDDLANANHVDNNNDHFAAVPCGPGCISDSSGHRHTIRQTNSIRRLLIFRCWCRGSVCSFDNLPANRRTCNFLWIFASDALGERVSA